MNAPLKTASRFALPGAERSRTRIKFCGFTRADDIARAVAMGVDAVGLVCVPGSRRYVSIDDAADLRRQVPREVAAVLLLSNASADDARRAIDAVDPDYVQFHGHESAEFCASFGRPYFKGVAARDTDSIRAAARAYPAAAALLLDSHGADGMGGTGQVFDWTVIPGDVQQPLILAGGLDPANAGLAVRMARPFAVDVSGGIEAAPGRKDPEKMQAFVDAVRQADTQRVR